MESNAENGPKRSESTEGLVLIQIDALSKSQLERALAEGDIPHLKGLMVNNGYKLHSLYSGLPSCTPSSQAEFFYGVKSAVPAFAYLDSTTGKIVKMFSHGPAAAIQNELEGKSQSLLAGGSSYSNIFDGGAARSSYCACQMGFRRIFAAPGALGLLPLFFRNPLRLIRLLGLMGLEAVLGIRDALRARVRPAMWRRESIFIINRIFVSVFLREIITVLATRDIRHGLPVIHVNYIGYDEHAHQRGPASPTALNHLGKIDAAISVLAQAIGKSQRTYQCWIYSDHGQEAVRSFESVSGRTLEAAIADITGVVPVVRFPGAHRPGTVREAARPAWLVSNPGPLVSLYPSEPLTLAQKETFSMALVTDAQVPMVFHSPEKGRVRVFTPEGWRELPDDGPFILGPGHPFPEECMADLIALCQHPLAGPLIASGWNANGIPISFFPESGSHGGMGKEEVHGFAMLPSHVPLPLRKTYFRFLDFRKSVLSVLNASTVGP